ncbi:MAG: carbamoyltransferase [Thermoleophilaceae bacterium]|nr:carbamoyltransferase [Thermoleophilaceae bacterium]
MSVVLGVSCHYHDSAAALLHDGALVAGAQEERFSRRKGDARLPVHAMRFCVDSAGLDAGDVDYVAFYEKPLLKLERTLASMRRAWPASASVARASMSNWMRSRLWIRDSLSRAAGVPPDRVLFVRHHESHAASAALCAPFDESAVLTIDGVGEWATAAIGRATTPRTGGGASSIDLDLELRFPHSIGLFYSALTQFLGFEVNEGEYKVMGLAAYGEPRFRSAFDRVVRLHADGSVELALEYFGFLTSLERMFSPRLADLLGVQPREPSAPFDVDNPAGTDAVYADIAASVQELTEDVVVAMARQANRRAGSRNLTMAGGVALNGIANRRVLDEAGFDNLFIQPAAGDGGGSLGAALFVEHVVLGRPRAFVMEDAYWGAEYGDDEIEAALRREGVDAERLDDDERLAELVASELVEGRIVGWFQGRFEWGPRALGNRSILADPRDPAMKATVNARIKYREPFRPFAPSMLREHAGEFVDERYLGQQPSKFMLMVLPALGEAGERIAAAVHGGTLRIQAVDSEVNPAYARVLGAFCERTGVPGVLNTSFNLKGEPIVASPADALSTFARSGIDTLVMGSHVVSKH